MNISVSYFSDFYFVSFNKKNLVAGQEKMDMTVAAELHHETLHTVSSFKLCDATALDLVAETWNKLLLLTFYPQFLSRSL